MLDKIVLSFSFSNRELHPNGAALKKMSCIQDKRKQFDSPMRLHRQIVGEHLINVDMSLAEHMSLILCQWTGMISWF